MLSCKVYSASGEELFSKDINYFSERIRKDGALELSLFIKVLAEEAATVLDAYKAIVHAQIGKVSIFKEDALVVEYEKYNMVDGVQVEYSTTEFSCAITFAIR